MNELIAALLILAMLTCGILPAYAQSSGIAQPIQIAAESDSVLAIAQEFISLLSQENYSSAIAQYSSDSGVSAASLQQTWQDTVAINGSLQQQVSTQVLESVDGFQIVIITCRFEQGTRDVVINFGNGKIVDFSVSES